MSRPADALPHALQPYWDLPLAAVQAEALQLALAEDLFETLASPCTPEAVALHQQRGGAALSGVFLSVRLW